MKTEPVEADLYYMERALAEAKKAELLGDVPIGAVLVADGKIVARGFNQKESAHDPTAHAEIVALREAANRARGWRLTDSTLYVTLEPCLMCMGALIQARVTRLVFSVFDPKAGACGSLYDLSNDERLNHSIKVSSGVAAKEAEVMLKSFFKKLREANKKKKQEQGLS